MLKKRRLLAGALSFSLVFGSITTPIYANTGISNLEAGSSVNIENLNQMSSEKELVYPSNISGEREQNFDENWKFFLGNADGAGEKNFNDSAWRELNLPHDYSIESSYQQNMEAESGYLPGGTAWYRKTFTLPSSMQGKRIRIDFGGVYMNATVYINGHKLGTHPYGYTPFSFDISNYINFREENVISVKVDHKTPSSRWYSGSGIYRSVNLVATDALHVDFNGIVLTTNDLSVDRNNVNLTVKSRIINESNEEKRFKVVNYLYKKGEDTEITSTQTSETSLAAGAKAELSSDLQVSNPDLWSVENPNLYEVKTVVVSDGQEVDTIYTDYGFRYFKFDKDNGFFLNGENIKLKGVCMHHDQGALGAVANKTAIRRQVEILKDMGTNSIRVTHNPAATELIEVCNELGIILIEEAFDGWHFSKNGNTYDYARHFNSTIEADNEILGKTSGMKWHEFDLKAMIERGINAPSIVMWSLGNEVMEGARHDDSYVDVIASLIQKARAIDNTRIVTTGDNQLKRESNMNNRYARMNQLLADAGGAVGLNYANGTVYDRWHRIRPDWTIYGAETASSINSRGIYKISGYTGQNASKQLTSYDKSKVGWGAYASEAWLDIIERDFIAGEYVWTGFDYIGEPTPWNGTDRGPKSAWPSPKNSFFGIIDTAGLPKDSYYLYRSLWNEDSTTLHILPAWNEDVVQKDYAGNVSVAVYSNAKSVRLMFTPEGQTTEQDLGLKAFTTKTSNNGNGNFTYQLYEGSDKSNTRHENLYLTYKVPYVNGTLRAIAYSDAAGTVEISDTVGTSTIKTAGSPAKITLKEYVDTDNVVYADGKDLSYIEVEIKDANGNLVPNAENRVDIEVSGNGKLVGLDNGNSVDHTSYKANYRNAFGGKLIAIVQAGKDAGEITIQASSQGLESAGITIESEESGEHDSSERRAESYKIAKNYYVKKGHHPILPATIEVNYTDGSTVEEAVVWDRLSDSDINRLGLYTLKGTLTNGLEVFVNINMIDRVAALLNYSTTTPRGVLPILPDSRPAVMENGEVLKVYFPVTWEEVSENSVANEGMIQVNGSALVMGDVINVTASIRVQNESITIGESISYQALELMQNIGGAQETDTLSAINDGIKQVDPNNSGAANPSIWSNWNAAQSGVTESELIFKYATQQRIGQASIFFAKDVGSLRYPEANTTEMWISEDGVDYTRVDIRETIASDEIYTNTKEYTYDFSPVTFTFIKFKLRNSTEATGSRWRPSIGVSEIELKKATGSYNTKTTTNLESLVVNGQRATAEELQADSYLTPALLIDDISYTAKDNASVTYVPDINNKKAYLIIESEDHANRRVYTIRLDEESADRANAEYSADDYDRTRTVATAGNEQNGEGAGNAVDGSTSTLWHTLWGRRSPVNERFIQLELEEETEVDGFRYYSRGGESNGRVREYQVLVSMDGVSWEEVATGTWANEGGWKLAEFDKVNAKYVKLVGVHTYGDGNQADRFMSAAEVRVRKASSKIDISNEDNNVVPTIENSRYIVENFDNPIKPNVTLTKDGNILRYGLDYKVRYENNDRLGRAFAIAYGILNYSGELRIPFEISSRNSHRLYLEDAELIRVDGEPANGREIFMPGQTLVIRANVYAGSNFSRFIISPENAYTGNVTSNEITVAMPNSTLLVKAVYDNRNIIYTTTNAVDRFVTGDNEELERILTDSLTEEELENINTGDVAELNLKVNINEYATLATSSNAGLATDSNSYKTNGLVENIMKRYADENSDVGIERAFFISTELNKKVGNFAPVKLEDRYTYKVSFEVDRARRNLAEYKIVSYRYSNGEDILSIVDYSIEDGIISFIASSDTVYGVYYNKAYMITFEDGMGTVLSSELVTIGEIPNAPEPVIDGYTFVGWDKEIVPAFKNTTYRAVLRRERDEENIRILKDYLISLIAQANDRLSDENSSRYTQSSIARLARQMERAENLVNDDDIMENELERGIHELQNAINSLREINQNSSGNTSGNTSGNSNNSNSSNNGNQGTDNNISIPNSGGGRGSSGGSGGSSGGGSGRAVRAGHSSNRGITGLGSIKLDGSWEKLESGTWNFRQKGINGSIGSLVKHSWGYTETNGIRIWYVFDNTGKMLTGWQYIEGYWYYFNDTKDVSEGVMRTGWQWINGKCYYLTETRDSNEGKLHLNTTIQNMYQVNKDGAWVVNGIVQTR